MQIDFFEEPTEVVDRLKSKIPTLTDDLDKIKGDAYKKAFTISDIAKKSLLADIQDSLVEALKDGKGFDEWRSDLFEHLQAKGWADKFESLNDDEISVLGDSSRLKLIYDTNIRQAYAEANYEAGINSNAEFIRYVAVLDERTRFSHASAHGLIFPIDNPWWEINYPPNGFNCRCSVMFLTAESMEARGWKPYDGVFPNIADKGFRKHSGKPYSATLKRLDKETIKRIKENDEIIRKKIDLKGVDDDILERIENIRNKTLENDIIAINMQNKKIRTQANKQLIEMFKNTDFSKSGYRPPLKEPLNLTKLKDDIKDILVNLDYNPINLFKATTQKKILHGMRLKKINDGNALTKSEFLKMPLKLTEKNFYIGHNEKGEKIFAFFWNKKSDRINYAYFDKNGDLLTYGKTEAENINRFKAVEGN